MHRSVLTEQTKVIRERSAATDNFWPLPGTQVAHVVIDMQNALLDDDPLIELPTIHEIVPNINALSRAVREAAGINIFIRYTFDPSWSSYFGRMSGQQMEKLGSCYTAGSHGHALSPELDVQSDDLVLDKTRLSCFVPGTCDLEAELRNRNLSTLLITGCVSNSCCESTARDASQRDFRVVFVDDANAALSDDLHSGAANNLASTFRCDIRPTTDVIAALRSPLTSTFKTTSSSA